MQPELTFTICLPLSEKFLNSRCIVLSQTMSKWSNEIVFSNIFNFYNNTLNYVCKPSVDIASPWSSFIKYSAEKILINKFLNYFCLNLRLTIASQCLPSSCQILQNLHFTTRFRLNYWQFSPSSSDVDTFFTNYSMFSFHHQLHLHH